MVDRLKTIRRAHLQYVKKCYVEVSALASSSRRITKDLEIYLNGMYKSLRYKEPIFHELDKQILSQLERGSDILQDISIASDNYTYLQKTLTFLEVVFEKLTATSSESNSSVTPVLSCVKENPYLAHLKKKKRPRAKSLPHISRSKSLEYLAVDNIQNQHENILSTRIVVGDTTRYVLPHSGGPNCRDHLMASKVIYKQNDSVPNEKIDTSSIKDTYEEHPGELLHEDYSFHLKDENKGTFQLWTSQSNDKNTGYYSYHSLYKDSSINLPQPSSVVDLKGVFQTSQKGVTLESEIRTERPVCSDNSVTTENAKSVQRQELHQQLHKTTEMTRNLSSKQKEDQRVVDGISTSCFPSTPTTTITKTRQIKQEIFITDYQIMKNVMCESTLKEGGEGSHDVTLDESTADITGENITARDGDQKQVEVISYYPFQPPDGGFGWVVVVAAFCAQFFVLGSMNNFGILYAELLNDFKRSKQETAWVGSITYGLMFGTGPIATSLSERIGCRPVAILGSIIAIVGTLLGSFSDSIYKMYLTQGFLFGVGASLCYFPSVIILPQYFCKRLSMVNGLVSCGSGLGTMAMGPVISYVIERYGWRTSVRVTTVLMTVVTVASCFYRPLLPPKRQRYRDSDKIPPIFDFTIFQNKAFLAFAAGLCVFMLAYFVPFVHLTQMALEYNVPMDSAMLLVGWMSVASTAGRLFFGKIADSKRVNRLYVYQLSLLGMGVINTLCPLFRTFTSLVIYSLVFGFFEGCYVCQAAVITGDIVGPERMAIAVGVLFGIKSIPLTLGPPLAGFLYDVSNSYQVAFYVAGAMPIVSACIMFAVPFLMPPPGHSFWRQNAQSGQHLISSSSEFSSSNSNNNNSNKSQNFEMNSCDFTDNALLNDSSAINNKSSAVSISSVNLLTLDKKVSMKEIGSISSFGSIAFSPAFVRRTTQRDTNSSIENV